MSEQKCVCRKCGHEQTVALTERTLCSQCKSYRVVPLKKVLEMFGPDWKRICFDRTYRTGEYNGS